MSCSKPLPPFTFDLLCYFNREQLERCSIVCRSLKNLIDRYFNTKPYRIFDKLHIRGGLYVLSRNGVQWHPNRDDYSVQQYLAGQKCSIAKSQLPKDHCEFYSFSDMRPYLGPTVRINSTIIYVSEALSYNPEHVAEMESIAYLWRNGEISIWNGANDLRRIRAEDFQLILNSPTILQCQTLFMIDSHFSFKDYKVLYSVKLIDICCDAEEDIDPSYWTEFFEQPGVKPVVALQYSRHQDTENVLDRLSKAFSSAVVPNAFKIVFSYVKESLTEFRETNKTSREKLVLNKGLPTNCESIDPADFDEDLSYTLERSSF